MSITRQIASDRGKTPKRRKKPSSRLEIIYVFSVYEFDIELSFYMRTSGVSLNGVETKFK